MELSKNVTLGKILKNRMTGEPRWVWKYDLEVQSTINGNSDLRSDGDGDFGTDGDDPDVPLLSDVLTLQESHAVLLSIKTNQDSMNPIV